MFGGLPYRLREPLPRETPHMRMSLPEGFRRAAGLFAGEASLTDATTHDFAKKDGATAQLESRCTAC